MPHSGKIGRNLAIAAGFQRWSPESDNNSQNPVKLVEILYFSQNIGLQECNYINLHLLKAVHLQSNYICILKQMKITFAPTNYTFPKNKKAH
jgi:hypothetical protein